MDWRYGLMKHERTFGTLVEYDEAEGIGFCRADNFKDWFVVREKDMMLPCGPYYIPTDDIAKPVKVGDVLECLVIETRQGLLGLEAKKQGHVEETDWNGVGTTETWQESIKIPRLIGVVRHWNFEKCYGFIGCDAVRTALYFHKKQLLVPIEYLSDPFDAISYTINKGVLVTFDSIETPRGMRALAVQQWTPETEETE